MPRKIKKKIPFGNKRHDKLIGKIEKALSTHKRAHTHTNANGEYTVTLRSSINVGETFILYFTSGSLVAQKRITQESR